MEFSKLNHTLQKSKNYDKIGVNLFFREFFMFDNIENTEIVSSLCQACKKESRIVNRKTNSFIIRTKGSVVYDFSGEKIRVNPGDMMFLPKGITYCYKTVSEDKSYYTSINFLGVIENPVPKCYSLKNFYAFERITGNFTDMWNFGSSADKFKCYSLFYDLLSYLSSLENTGYKEKHRFSVIDPALDYLTEHLYDPSLKADKLHRLCGISDTYFRKIFISRFGESPQSYITQKRISHARTLLDSGDFDSVKDIAFSSGYSDALYFSKVFKKHFGITPTDSIKQI